MDGRTDGWDVVRSFQRRSACPSPNPGLGGAKKYGEKRSAAADSSIRAGADLV